MELEEVLHDSLENFLPLFYISAEPITIEKLQNLSFFPLNKSP